MHSGRERGTCAFLINCIVAHRAWLNMKADLPTYLPSLPFPPPPPLSSSTAPSLLLTYTDWASFHPKQLLGVRNPVWMLPKRKPVTDWGVCKPCAKKLWEGSLIYTALEKESVKELHGIFAWKPCDLVQELTCGICRTNLDASCLVWNSATLSAQVFLPAFVNAESTMTGRAWNTMILCLSQRNLAFLWSRKREKKSSKSAMVTHN